MIVIGIDPGLDGAIAFVEDGLQLIEVFDTPTIATTLASSKKRRRLYDIAAMLELLRRPCTEARYPGGSSFVAIEEQQAFPGRVDKDGNRRPQGVASTFSTGRGVGIWEALLVATDHPYEFVRAQRWKRAMLDGLDRTSKTSSLVAARRLFPDAELGRKKDAGRADALLLAAFALRVLVPGVEGG